MTRSLFKTGLKKEVLPFRYLLPYLFHTTLLVVALAQEVGKPSGALLRLKWLKPTVFIFTEATLTTKLEAGLG